MTPLLLGGQLFALAMAGFLLVGSILTALAVRGLGARIRRWPAESRHSALLLLAALPVLCAGVLMLAVSLPSLASLVVPSVDHCPRHDDQHAHLCFVHLPDAGLGVPASLALLCVAGHLACRAALVVAPVLRALRLVRSLVATGEDHAGVGVTLLDTDQPLCLAVGLLRPRVLVSRGLLAALGPEERAVILAHERAHVRRRDALVGVVARLVAVVQVPHVARWLMRELEIAAEEACDGAAASAVGDRLAVASTILLVERQLRLVADAALVPAAVRFGACAVERRIEALLVAPSDGATTESTPSGGLGRVWLCLGACALAALIGADALHHLTESLLAFVTH